MKVFIFMRFLNYSGAPKMLMWVANQLAIKGHEVTLYTYSFNKDVTPPSTVTYKHDDLDHCSFGRKVLQIRKRIIESEADVSISFLLDANVYNTLACLGIHTKSIICERNDPFKPHYYKLWFWKPLFRLADGAVFQLEKVRDFYSNIKTHTTVIPNPITFENSVSLKPFSKRKKAIVTLGRIDITQKRQDLLIKAFERVHKLHPDYELIIHGRGFDEDKLRKIIDESPAKENIIFAGVTLHAQESIKEYQIFVQSSDFEGIPNSLIEAMVIGMPCVATDCSPGGAKLLIQNKVNGLLVPRNNAARLAENIIWLIENPDKADLLGERAKEIKNQFSEEDISKCWEEYLNKEFK